MGAIRTQIEHANYIATIINAQGTINNSAGKLSTAFKLAEHGFDAFTLELTIEATGTTDALDWEMRYSQDGTNFDDFLAASKDSGSIANTSDEKKVLMSFIDRPFHSAKLFVASAGATDTWTVTAKVRRVLKGDWQ